MNREKQTNQGSLKRVLSLTDLIIYGIILIQPVAALPLFGHANSISKGHAVTSILVAMVAMIFTAFSYGRMASIYPSAGSAYTYVGKSINPYLGFLAGWSMFMDYIFIPILCIVFTSITANHLLPFIPYYLWILFFACGFTFLNLFGVKITSKANWILMVVMSAVVFYFMAAAIRYIVVKNGLSGLFTSLPFYNPVTFSVSDIASATSLAALTYIGFDGLTTLSEEVKNPKKNVMLAAVATCLITGIWSGAQIYLAQVSLPDWNSITSGLTSEYARVNALDTAIMSVANRVGGNILDSLLSITLLIGSIGSGIAGQLGASRLLYGMGRDKVIPNKFFGHLNKKNGSPVYNVIFIGILALTGAFLLNYEECARLINFGAFFAFMGVNIASAREFFFKQKKKTFHSFILNFLPPVIGFIFCLAIWLSLPLLTFIIGGSWLIVGIIYIYIKSRGFRDKLDVADFLKV